MTIVPYCEEQSGPTAALLNREIREGFAHFGTVEITPNEFHESRCHGLPAFVMLDSSNRLVGIAMASPHKPRQGYANTVEIGVYVDPKHWGQGLGTKLISHMIAECRSLGLHTLLAGIAQPNEASVRLFERAGFRQVGLFPEVGFKLGEWRSVAYFALVLDS